jgi:hypothetical protein
MPGVQNGDRFRNGVCAQCSGRLFVCAVSLDFADQEGYLCGHCPVAMISQLQVNRTYQRPATNRNSDPCLIYRARIRFNQQRDEPMQALRISLDFMVAGVRSPKLMHDENGDPRTGFLRLKQSRSYSGKQLVWQLQYLRADFMLSLISGRILIVVSDNPETEKGLA